ncbi:KilA-N domain-containing protein [Gemella sp. 19428wG2_WT2a]|nr:KilA-N domain-containing protein [Gemella sp. 19428wG2_WT2a]TFU60222.1 KilA-N domain-containing protein [Gemella sp. WT2a]
MKGNNKNKMKIYAQGREITLLNNNEQEYISLTDIAKYRSEDSSSVIQSWLRNRNTIEFVGLWEQLNNPNFKPHEFEGFKNQAGLNGFVLSPKKWIESTDAIGIISKSGRYGGTYAHPDIAFEFASWISPEFKLYIIQDYQKLKNSESYKNQLEWNAQRFLTKTNYKIHTDAIKNNLISNSLTPAQKGFKYASEADMLNVVLFGITAKEWRSNNPELKGNIRDFASIEELIVLSNLENYNSILIEKKIDQSTRMQELRKTASKQLAILYNVDTATFKKLEQQNKVDS